jgi:hypothetical protein
LRSIASRTGRWEKKAHRACCETKPVASGSVNGNRLTLKLRGPSKSKSVTYLDSGSWNPDNLLYGKNSLAVLTFCQVSIEK